MINRVEAVGQVEMHGEAERRRLGAVRGEQPAGCGESAGNRTAGTKTEAAVVERGFQDRLEDLFEGRVDDAVLDGEDAQPPRRGRAGPLGDVDPADRLRPIAVVHEIVRQACEPFGGAAFEFAAGDAIDAGGAGAVGAADAFPTRFEVAAIEQPAHELPHRLD
jgi:hypothetical protein